MYKKNRLETLSIPVFEEVEFPIHKVKQCSSPKREHFAKHIPVDIMKFRPFKNGFQFAKCIFLNMYKLFFSYKCWFYWL
ncbi:hypothetical protein BAS10_00460 [Elizabethkingia meningoseptica]|nr:hypothetical protein BAS10_00460 [Elizabethkingia meningoseptica]